MRTIALLFLSGLFTANLIVSSDEIGPEFRADYIVFFEQHSDYISNGFQMPVGPPDGKGYYNAQLFGVNLHLGEDWNGVGGGDTDLGDPVFSICNGYVSEAKDYKGGWGNIVRIIHKMPDGYEYKYVESIYAHLDRIDVEKGDSLKVGEQLGTIGNAHGSYPAHLHLEMRSTVGLSLRGGYGQNTKGYLIPSDFIKQNTILD